ncbi:zinc finger BED domain-containing protein 1-like [Xyrichtys novacula]|uniref:Zinc finger BED domain-containing protein 1-like n=1 Tax=Xyrichtys novacula TaxID=13765 RepID=A0AAV1FEA7_XYRNO|nr:zinc finger BED domain-containing protein 1-like [Xyrichtys novacula]
MIEWGIEKKVSSFVTDAGANMIASVRKLGLRSVPCYAHALNLVVKKSIENTPGLEDLRTRSRKVVTYFKTSTRAKEVLQQVQKSTGRETMKLIQEVDTRWNSTYDMFQRLYEERQTVGSALAVLTTKVRPLASEDYETMAACIAILNPFKKATNELSEEKRVSGSVAIPMTKMLLHSMIDLTGKTSHATAKILGQNLIQQMTSRFDGQEDSTACNLATLLDPRFKMIGFHNQGRAHATMRRLVSECASVMRTSLQPSTTNQPEPAHPAIHPADNETPAASTGYIIKIIYTNCIYTKWDYKSS